LKAGGRKPFIVESHQRLEGGPKQIQRILNYKSSHKSSGRKALETNNGNVSVRKKVEALPPIK